MRFPGKKGGFVRLNYEGPKNAKNAKNETNKP